MIRKQLFILMLSLFWQLSALAVEVLDEKLGDALIRIAKPAEWNGNVLLLAHGYRPVEAAMSADFSLQGHFYKTMLERGWLVAATSYRRNGFLLKEASEDIEQLRQEIRFRFGGEGLTLLSGNSMGGGIVTYMAENSSADYDGALALGAYLDQNPSRFKPQIPLLFLTNRSELDGPKNYVARAAKSKTPPALWTIDRDGHVNIGHEEWLVGIDGLLAFIDSGNIETGKDITIKSLIKSKAAFTADGALTKVTTINASYGNIETEFTSEDLDALNIKTGDNFWLSLAEKTYKVKLGTTYSDVSRGQWVAFINAEGTLRIARNYDNAAETLGCKIGDNIMITR